MGYYTNFTLALDPSTTVSKEILEQIDQVITDWDVLEYTCTDCWYGSAKWYEYQEDMCALSKQFPNVIFCLSGEGEDAEDLWCAYFLGGKMQFCPAEITYESFDPEKLKEIPSIKSLS